MYRNLEAELARKGITRADIAKVLGVALGTVSEKLNNSRKLKVYEAMKIRKAFFPDLDFDYLFETQETSESA
jgi:transcriptional regulator with XRE-family HTH domain